MHRLSIVQVLSLWMSLEDAFHGSGSYGGDVAEICVFRLMSSNPLAERSREMQAHAWAKARQGMMRGTTSIVEVEGNAAYLEASETLYNLLVHFAKERCAIVEIEVYQPVGGWTFVEVGVWMKKVEETQRWHVRVRPRKDKT